MWKKVGNDKRGITRRSTLKRDDIKWIAKCMDDNKNEGQTVEVVRKYCECMVSKWMKMKLDLLLSGKSPIPKNGKSVIKCLAGNNLLKKIKSDKHYILNSNISTNHSHL